MKKLLVFLLVPMLLCPCAAGAENPKYLALSFEGCPQSPDAGYLLEGLADRGVRATFFLREEDCPQSAHLHRLGHELGIFSQVSPALSRREMAREIAGIRAGLPRDCRVRLLRHEGGASIGFRQVAEALGLSLLEPSLDPEAARSLGQTVLDRAADGDVLLLGAEVQAAAALELVDQLRQRGFTFVTVSELARLRAVPLRPGACFRGFYPKKDTPAMSIIAPLRGSKTRPGGC